MSRALKADVKVDNKTESKSSAGAAVAAKERSAASVWKFASLFQAGVAGLVPVKARPEAKEAPTEPRARPIPAAEVGAKKNRSIPRHKLAETVVMSNVRAKAGWMDGSVKPGPAQEQQTVTTHDPAKVHAKKNNDKSGILLFVAGSCMVIGFAGLLKLAFFPHSHHGSTATSAADMSPKDRKALLEQMVQFQRTSTGLRLNEERANVELENEATAPDLSPFAQHIPRPNMMNGVPIAGEDYSRRDEKDPPVNPDFPDSRIQLGLQEDIDQADWQMRAQQQYIEDFKASAKEAGYNVKIDKWGRVTYSPNGHPYPANPTDADGDPVPAFPGAIR